MPSYGNNKKLQVFKKNQGKEIPNLVPWKGSIYSYESEGLKS